MATRAEVRESHIVLKDGRVKRVIACDEKGDPYILIELRGDGTFLGSVGAKRLQTGIMKTGELDAVIRALHPDIRKRYRCLFELPSVTFATLRALEFEDFEIRCENEE